MKKIPILLLLLTSVLVCLIACSEDYSEKNLSSNRNLKSNLTGLKLQNGILVFENKQVLKNIVDEFTHYSNEDRRAFLSPFYQDGFNPLYLNFNENIDQGIMNNFVTRKFARIQKITKFSPNYSEDLHTFDDDLIADDSFASFLNDEREIIVGDSLYKYTYNGIYRSKATDSLPLHQYVNQYNLAYIVSGQNNLTPGTIEVAPGVEEVIQTPVQNLLTCNPTGGLPGQAGFTNSTAILPDCPPPAANTNSSAGSSSEVDSQIEWMQDLEPCDAMNGIMGDWSLFGTVKKCHDYFDDNRRTKTKYWKENYLIYNSIGVKVKHQKYKSIIFGAGWWYASETDEVALSISQASFSYDMPVTFPTNYNAPTLYFFDDKVYSQNSYLAAKSDYQNSPFPELPFNSEVIVTQFINQPTGLNITPEQIRELFYTGVWEGAKFLVNAHKSRAPKNVTHIIYTPSRIYLNYVDLDRRNLNDEQITNVLDYNFGLGFKFNVYISGDGTLSTNWGNFANNPTGFISIPKLYDYDNIQMDFVGATRHGNVWKGSRIVYSD